MACVINRHTKAPKRHSFPSACQLPPVKAPSGCGVRGGSDRKPEQPRPLSPWLREAGSGSAVTEAGSASRLGPPRSQPASRPPRAAPPPAARCVGARWLFRTEARVVCLQKFPPWVAADLVTSVAAAPAAAAAAAAVTVRDGGGCSGTCNSPAVCVFSLLFMVIPLSPFPWLVSPAEVVVFLAGFSGASQML